MEYLADSTLINHLKKFFKISEYNWPILDSNENFKDPSKFLDPFIVMILK